MRTLLIDNHDSFTFNLVHLLAEVMGTPPIVVRNDEAPWESLRALGAEAIVLSPGPGRPSRPRDFGVCRDVVLGAEVPLLGVCLGHQGIAELAGAAVVPAPEPVHGRPWRIEHDGEGLFAGLPRPLEAVRYHSLVVDRALPARLRRTAWTADGLVMGVARRDRPHHGVQFHPESIGTPDGKRLLENFRDLARAWTAARGRVDPRMAAATPTPAAKMAPTTPPKTTPAANMAPTTPPKATPAATVTPPKTTPAAAMATTTPALELRARRLPLWPDAERAFSRLCAADPRAFWLDSSAPGEGARFSFLGAGPGPHGYALSYRVGGPARPPELRIERPDGRVERHAEELLPFVARELERAGRPAGALPFDFNGGFVGLLGYGLKADCGLGWGRPGALPDAALVFADRLIALDHAERVTWLVCLARPDVDTEAEAWLDQTARALEALAPLDPLPERAPAAVARPGRAPAAYRDDVRRCLGLLGEGESYELCLTTQHHVDVTVDPLRLHRALRRINPAPYAALLRLGPDAALACSSPERFLRLDRAGAIEARPIKGTRPRGATAAEDAALAADLAASPKERAENLMIVDLMRHDLGRVCAPGSVSVPRLMEVERHATVHQLVSTVRGRLAAGRTAVDAVRAAFPPGSMTGAPKERSIELLDALEPEARGPYAGAIGYLALCGAADLNVVIRTAVVTPGRVSIGSGGAVVALSEPAAEHDEMLLKAAPLLRALGSALAPG